MKHQIISILLLAVVSTNVLVQSRVVSSYSGNSNNFHVPFLNNGSFEPNCEWENMTCTCLEPNPPSDSAPPLDLWKLLQEGSDYLKDYPYISEAILLLGNTGVGKSTAAQIMATDLSRLHAVVNSGKSGLVIVDEDEKIGAPSTESKTLLPELVIKPANPEDSLEAEVAFYDFPGFDDNRGYTKDIAANFFTTEVVKKIANLKMLFFTSHYDVREGGDRNAFDLLVDHAVTFAYHIEKFSNSFALVVNKVACTRCDDDENVVSGVKAFLSNYNQTLSRDLENEEKDKEKTLKKILFVNQLLEENRAGEYFRIWFIRSADYCDCGSLDKCGMMVDTETHLAAMYHRLVYSPVEKDSFRFTLKDSTLLKIRELVQEINQKIVQKMEKATDELSRNYIKQLQKNQEKSTLVNIFERLSQHHELYEQLLITIQNRNPFDLYNSLNTFAKSLGLKLFSELELFMSEQQNRLDLLDKITGEEQTRDVVSWTESLPKLGQMLLQYKEWLQFCLRLEDQTTNSEFPSRQLAPPSTSQNVLDYIEENNILIVTDRIREIATKVDQDLHAIAGSLLTFATEGIKYSCQNKVLVIQGNFVSMEEEIPKIASKMTETGCVNSTVVDVYAAQSIYLTKGAEKPWDLLLLAPTCIIEEESEEEEGTTKATMILAADPPHQNCLDAWANTRLNWTSILRYKLAYFNESSIHTEEFIRAIDTSDTTAPLFTLKALAEEIIALNKIDSTKVNQERLRYLYSSLLERLNFHYAKSFETAKPEMKKIMVTIITSTNGRLMGLKEQLELDVIVDASRYLQLTSMQVDYLESIETRAKMKRTIQLDKSNLEQSLLQEMTKNEHLKSSVITSAVILAVSEIEAEVEVLQSELKRLVLDRSIKLEVAEMELIEFERAQRIHRHSKAFEVLGMVSPFPVGGDPFSRMVDELEAEFGDDNKELVFRLREMANKSEEYLSNLEVEKESFKNSCGALLNAVDTYFMNVRETLAEDEKVEDLPFPKSELLANLRRCKSSLQDFSRESSSVYGLVLAFDRIQDYIFNMMDMYQMIDEYLIVQNLDGLYALLTSTELDPVKIEDPEFINAVTSFDKDFKSNLVEQEMNKASRTFNQWVFPFAKFYEGQVSRNYFGELDQSFQGRLKLMQYELDRYKSMLVLEDRSSLVQLTNFSSGLKSSKPFHVWKNSQWHSDIRSLLSGSSVNFEAQVNSPGNPQRDAIKFKQIEINLKFADDAPSGLQEEFNEILEYFGMRMTHTGTSAYKLNNEYFIMTGENHTIQYNFETDGRGNRLGTNMVYEQFKKGEFLASPYTVWTLQIFRSTTSARKPVRSDISFEQLLSFEPYIDVELVGMGLYVNGTVALEAAGGDLNLGKYYERDDRYL